MGKNFKDDTHFFHSPRMSYSYLTYSPARVAGWNFRGFLPPSLPHYGSSYSTGQGTSVQILPITKYIFSNYISGPFLPQLSDWESHSTSLSVSFLTIK